jgi:hypothetical protein
MTEEHRNDRENNEDGLVAAIRASSSEIATAITTAQQNPGSVGLSRTRGQATADLLLWHVIRRSNEALAFNNYRRFVDAVLCNNKEVMQELQNEGAFDQSYDEELDTGEPYAQAREAWRPPFHRRFLPYTDTDAYRLLKAASEAFLIVHCGVRFNFAEFEAQAADVAGEIDTTVPANLNLWLDNYWNKYREEINGTSYTFPPYLMLIRQKLSDLPVVRNLFREPRLQRNTGDTDCYGILMEKLHMPCFIELIWSYWEEQGMLVQTMKALSRRFQNVRSPAERDPLAMVEIDPLRPLNNLLWGYIQDEQHRLSLVRRTYEYDHHYGLRLEGKAVPALRPADSRSRFLEVFHNLLAQTIAFYKVDDDATMNADAFPVLNALQDLHLVLSEGAHNQYGDLPTTARIEMLMEQWLLARPEFREVLPTRIMVAYAEPWMDRVDAMKRLQGWPDISVNLFHNLAVWGERLLLSVRFADWNSATAPQALVWARFWRAEIQGYIHAYRAVTGVDLTAAAQVSTPQQRALMAMQPSSLLLRHARNGQPASRQLPPPTPAMGLRERRAARRNGNGNG